MFSELMNAREEGDYVPILEFEDEEVEELIQDAERFVEEMERVRGRIRVKEEKMNRMVGKRGNE